MGTCARKASRRKKLWKDNPYCRNCGVLTELPEKGKAIKDNTATIQHVNPKGDPLRGKGVDKNTLWCNKCNLQDGHDWGDLLQKERQGGCE